MVLDIEELENSNASDIHARRLHAKEVLMPNIGEHFILQIADGTVKVSGNAQVFRKSTSIRDRFAVDLNCKGFPSPKHGVDECLSVHNAIG